MSAMGRAKSTNPSAVRRRWKGIVKRQPYSARRSWWDLIDTSIPLPSAQQAALDIDGLFMYIDGLEEAARQREAELKAFAEILDIVGSFTDGTQR